MLADDFAEQLIAQQCLQQHSGRLTLKALAAMWTRAPLQLIADSLDHHRLEVRPGSSSHARCSQLPPTIRTTIVQLDPANLIRLGRRTATAPVAGMPFLCPALLGAMVFG